MASAPPTSKPQASPVHRSLADPHTIICHSRGTPLYAAKSYIWTFGDGAKSVATDPVHSRATAGTVAYPCDDANRLTSVGGVSYTYDDAGNLRYDGT